MMDKCVFIILLHKNDLIVFNCIFFFQIGFKIILFILQKQNVGITIGISLFLYGNLRGIGIISIVFLMKDRFLFLQIFFLCSSV